MRRDDQHNSEPSLEVLRSAIQMACQPQNAHRIEAGRREVLGLPREWVLSHIEGVAAEVLDLSDYWEYRRLLELASLLSAGLVLRLVPLGLHNGDADVREAAEAFQANPTPDLGGI